MEEKEEIILGRLQKYENFGFILPFNRDIYQEDFFVANKNLNGAEEGNKVRVEILERQIGKKIEVKIVEIIKNDDLEDKISEKNIIEGIYSRGNGNFGFIDVPGEEKGVFVYGKKKNGALDGDKVRASVSMFKGREEAIVLEVLGTEQEIVIGEYRDNDRFGFVTPDDGGEDIFIAGSRKGEAIDGDFVEVAIIKTGGRRAEGMIRKILE